MFLRSLTLRGFKSFADTTTLEFEPGVTVVVGPNGSGKSNVVDAVAWVLGAQAPSAVRSQKMDDVIFAGTDRRPALGRAEVRLTIDNSAGLLPIEFTEVTLARTLFRTGESEYAINGVPCRLLDIQELLSDTGVGRQQHVIVSQGQIDAVLNARPEERRAVIEEAAGILKHRKRKEKAERRLEATETNLLRLQDLLREVRRQLRPLERQAEAARRHGEIAAELEALRLHLAGREIVALRGRLATLEAQRGAGVDAEAALRHELAALDTSVMAAEDRLGALGGSDLADVVARVEQLRERARGLDAVIVERRRATERDVVRLLHTSMVASLEADAAGMRDELEEVAASLRQLEPEAADLARDEQTLTAERQAASGSRPVAGALGAAAEARGELRTRAAAVERGAAEAARLSGRLVAVEERAARLAEESERVRAECAAAEAVEAPLVGAILAAEQVRVEREAALALAERAHMAALAHREACAARTDALALAVDQARARAGAERLEGVDGVVGTLVELVDVDEGWEAAFEAAAGQTLASVIIQGVEPARRALARLRAAATPGAVLALGTALPAVVAPPAGEAVRRHVRARQGPSSAGVDRLLDALLGAVVVADGGWEQALTIALDHPGALVVTRDGDCFGPLGWRVGGSASGATGAALDEARAVVDAAEVDIRARVEEVAAARLALSAARTAEAQHAARLDDHDAAFAAGAERLGGVQAERRDAITEADALRAALTEVEERHGREMARLTELQLVLPGLEAEESAEAEAARAHQLLVASLDERAAILQDRRHGFVARTAALEERGAFLRRRIEEIEARLRADTEARAGAEARRLQLARVIAALDRLHAVVARHQEVLDAEHEALAERRRRQTEAARAAAADLDSLRHRRAIAERQLEEARERERRTEIEQAEVRMRLEAVVDTLRRDHDVEPEVALVAECPPLPEGTSPAGRARELERELRILGPVNPLALEEFTALQERHRFLEAQLEDVRATRRELARVIKAVDAEIEAVFEAAFADVSAHFAALFGTLFPGGRGELVLTQPDNLLDTGIELEAKPSGKNVKKLSLLSGGERSLTALAFLFAVFRSRPSPFYVMDEVEAALDDVNLHRFLGLVEEFRREAQLIIVSHQKRTMEAADSLYGVTMQPGGSSKVVSERMRANA